MDSLVRLAMLLFVPLAILSLAHAGESSRHSDGAVGHVHHSSEEPSVGGSPLSLFNHRFAGVGVILAGLSEGWSAFGGALLFLHVHGTAPIVTFHHSTMGTVAILAGLYKGWADIRRSARHSSGREATTVTLGSGLGRLDSGDRGPVAGLLGIGSAG